MSALLLLKDKHRLKSLLVVLSQAQAPSVKNYPAILTALFSSLFHGVSDCTINFVPQSINVGVGLGGVASTEEIIIVLLAHYMSNVHC